MYDNATCKRGHYKIQSITQNSRNSFFKTTDRLCGGFCFWKQLTDWMCDVILFHFEKQLTDWEMEFLIQNHWLTAQWNSFSKTTDWLCDRIPFQKKLTDSVVEFFNKKNCKKIFVCTNNWLPVQWNLCIQTTHWLCHGIYLENHWLSMTEFSLKNNWLTVRWNFF